MTAENKSNFTNRIKLNHNFNTKGFYDPIPNALLGLTSCFDRRLHPVVIAGHRQRPLLFTALDALRCACKLVAVHCAARLATAGNEESSQ